MPLWSDYGVDSFCQRMVQSVDKSPSRKCDMCFWALPSLPGGQDFFCINPQSGHIGESVSGPRGPGFTLYGCKPVRAAWVTRLPMLRAKTNMNSHRAHPDQSLEIGGCFVLRWLTWVVGVLLWWVSALKSGVSQVRRWIRFRGFTYAKRVYLGGFVWRLL